tara:strand:- start:199 stop:411 length:213 start_codon:yes stop_codon:yes gene_type:complete
MDKIRGVRITEEEMEAVEALQCAVERSSWGMRPSKHYVMQKALRRGLTALQEELGCEAKLQDVADAWPGR